MLEWADYAAPVIDAQANTDETYLQLRQSRDALRADYEAVLASLTPAHREIIVTHEYLCEEMEYQKTRLAYQFGKLRGKA